MKDVCGISNRIFVFIDQVKLEAEILQGDEVKKVLVDFARIQETCMLILSSNKHSALRLARVPQAQLFCSQANDVKDL